MRLLIATVITVSFAFATVYFGWVVWREPASRSLSSEDEQALDEMLQDPRVRYDRHARLTPQEAAALHAHNARRAARKARFWSRVGLVGTGLSIVGAVGGFLSLLSHC